MCDCPSGNADALALWEMLFGILLKFFVLANGRDAKTTDNTDASAKTALKILFALCEGKVGRLPKQGGAPSIRKNDPKVQRWKMRKSTTFRRGSILNA